MRLSDFHNLHAGQTCLIVGVGPNLKLTPPEAFDLPSFGCNSIYRYEGWQPTYYVGVDERLRLEDGPAIVERYPFVPKFFPTPDWDDLEGPEIYRFKHRTGELMIGGQLPNHPDALTQRGIAYRRIMDAVIQIAWHFGFAKMLMIGVQHAPEGKAEHFWGHDPGEILGQPVEHWFDGYRYFAHGMGAVQLLNISEDTYVPEDVLPRDDWRKYATPKAVEKPHFVLEIQSTTMGTASSIVKENANGQTSTRRND